MPKKLIINCATCDARGVQAELYANYEAITINSATLLTSPEAKAALSSLPLTLNCSNVLEVPADARLLTFNGRYEVNSSDAVPTHPYFLLVNGALNIHPGTQAQLASCVGIAVNGSLTCPESIYAGLSGVQVNGATVCYPDGAIVLPRNAVIDGVFALRAKNSLYWSAKRLILVDPALDGAALEAKGATFRAEEAILAQSKAQELIGRIDEQTKLILVPDGTAVVTDDLKLDQTALRRYGRQLYVLGDVTVPEDGSALAELRYLNVRGDIRVPQAHRDALLAVLAACSGEIRIAKPRGATLKGKPFVRITRWMLERQQDGLAVVDCAVVQLAPDIPKEWIPERLQIQDCAIVRCSEEQEDAVALICEDVAQIGEEAGEDGAGRCTSGGLRGLLDTKIINAAQYVL